MKEERVWKIGPTWESIYDVFTQTLQLVEECPNVYLASDFLETANVSKQDWDLDEDDEFFAYMEEENFKGLQPFDPMDDPMDPIITYDMLEPPSSDPPRKVWELEDCAARIAAWFSKLRKCKVSEDGVGIAWPDTPGTWRPRERFKYEYDLYSGSILTVPFQISAAHYTGYDPHHVYHAWFGDDCQDGGVLRSEVQILVGCIRSQMRLYYLCEYNFPVSTSPTLMPLATRTTANIVRGTHALRPWHKSPSHDCQLQP